MPHYIRIGKTKAEEWTNGVGTAAVLTPKIFRLKKTPQKDVCEESTYQVDGEIEETHAAAAHLLADPRPKIEPCYLIRFRSIDLEEAGVRLSDAVLGTTGIVRIDFRHRDLVGAKEQFERLVEVVLGRLRNGQDRIRRFGNPQLQQALEWFAGRPATERPSRTEQIIKCCLSGSEFDSEVREADVALARNELTNISVPDDTIRLRAFCLGESSQGTGTSGGDWDAAEKSLRAEYAKHYLHEQFGRP